MAISAVHTILLCKSCSDQCIVFVREDSEEDKNKEIEEVSLLVLSRNSFYWLRLTPASSC